MLATYCQTAKSCGYVASLQELLKIATPNYPEQSVKVQRLTQLGFDYTHVPGEIPCDARCRLTSKSIKRHGFGIRAFVHWRGRIKKQHK